MRDSKNLIKNMVKIYKLIVMWLIIVNLLIKVKLLDREHKNKKIK
jgi:hypothetical protein